jgi:hypothetical protein
MPISKVLKYSIRGFVVVVLAGFIFFEIACRERSDHCKCSAFSNDRKTAIEEGFYIDTYIPIQSFAIISNKQDTLNFDSAWTEHSWTMVRRFGVCLFEYKTKGKGYNFCIPFSTTSSDLNSNLFELKQLPQINDPYYDPGGFLGNRFNFGLSGLSDTIRVILTQKQKDTISPNSSNDTLLFVRQTSR